jgi:opacity protein-like surface antigen
MKKVLLIVVIIVVCAAAVAVAGVAYAQIKTLPGGTLGIGRVQVGPSTDTERGNKGGYGPGMMGGGGGFGSGMMGQRGANWEYGSMHQYMLEALAEQLGLTPDELQTKLQNGTTPYQIAKDKGLTDDQIRDLLTKAQDAALEKAVAAGAITQEQADQMDKHMEQMWQYGPGLKSGSGSCFGGCPGTNWDNK